MKTQPTITVPVPTVAEGVKFYTEALGFTVKAEDNQHARLVSADGVVRLTLVPAVPLATIRLTVDKRTQVTGKLLRHIGNVKGDWIALPPDKTTVCEDRFGNTILLDLVPGGEL